MNNKPVVIIPVLASRLPIVKAKYGAVATNYVVVDDLNDDGMYMLDAATDERMTVEEYMSEAKQEAPITVYKGVSKPRAKPKARSKPKKDFRVL